MSDELVVSIGQYSDKGRKAVNQDFHGAFVPDLPLRRSKGVALALADGISSSNVSQVASETAVKTFLEDYYATSEAWSVQTSVERVVASTNAWLHAQTQQSRDRFDRDRGYVCTFSAIVVKSTTAYLFHVGDARILRIRGAQVEQLTEDHRVWVSQDRSYLARALGIAPRVEIDYEALAVECGDVFVLACDGVHEFVETRSIADAIAADRNDLARAARAIVDLASDNGSGDNLTVQIVAIDALPDATSAPWRDDLGNLAPPPLLEARQRIDEFEIVRELHGSSRSHVYLARVVETGENVALKTPSIDWQEPAHLERFLLQEWIARRIDSVHVVKARRYAQPRSALYVVTDYVDGQTLSQWMIDHPEPDLETVRGIVEQIAAGLRAFHRLEMLHQDLRPENVMLDRDGTAKIIDFGSARVAGIDEAGAPEADEMPGTFQYSAPEYFLGDRGSVRSDLFSLGVIAYQMLSGRLPYGADVPKARTRKAQKRLRYRSVLDDARAVPTWVDDALRKAVESDPLVRYGDLSEFTFDLRHPNPEFATRVTPLIERDPLLFWKALSAVLFALVVAMAYLLGRR